MQNYSVYGKEVIDIIVEIGLGASMKEWEPFATDAAKEHGVLLYERYGINHSEESNQPRTPVNIAKELSRLLADIPHAPRLIIIGHSQGGLYAGEFCLQNPNLVKGLILVDPLSPRDVEFCEQLTAAEYKKSGVDKTGSFKMIQTMLKLGMKRFIRKQMKQAPPFYYYDGFTKEQEDDILSALTKKSHLKTSLEEYACAHNKECLGELTKPGQTNEIPLVLITHNSELAIKENMEFGNNTRDFAQKIENMWQEIMKYYLTYSKKSLWVQAEKSTHYIHLTEPELIMKAVEELEQK